MNIIKILVTVAIGAFLLIIIYRYLFHQQYVREPALDGKFVHKKIYFGGIKRTYSCFYPNTLSDGVNIIVALHGSRDDGSTFRKRTGYELDEIASREKLIVIYPDGYKKSWNDCRKEARYPSKKQQIDDVGFLKQIIKEVSVDLEIVTGHIFLFAYSNGGQLANRICLEDPGWSSAACVMHANLPVPENTDCIMQDGFVPMMILGGTKDKTNPYNGGLVNVLGLKKLGYVRSANESANYWVLLHEKLEYRQRSISIDSRTQSNAGLEKREWIDYMGVAQVVQFVVDGGGHTIPNTKMDFPRALGTTNRAVSFYEEAWDFFSLRL